MATVNFCERCNSMGKSSAMGRLSLAPNPSWRDETKELCPACVKELYAWMAEETFGPREKAYQEPYDPNEAETDVDKLTTEELSAALVKRMQADIRALEE